MLSSPQRDRHVEFVAEQLRNRQWIHGYRFVDRQGYHLDWSIQGVRRMALLQIALKDDELSRGLDRVPEDEPETHAAISDFWEACLSELALAGCKDSLPIFVRIIKGWRPRD